MVNFDGIKSTLRLEHYKDCYPQKMTVYIINEANEKQVSSLIRICHWFFLLVIFNKDSMVLWASEPCGNRAFPGADLYSYHQLLYIWRLTPTIPVPLHTCLFSGRRLVGSWLLPLTLREPYTSSFPPTEKETARVKFQLGPSASVGQRWMTAAFISLKATSAKFAPRSEDNQKGAVSSDTDSQ